MKGITNKRKKRISKMIAYLKQAFEEVKLYEQGKIKLKSAKDFLQKI